MKLLVLGIVFVFFVQLGFVLVTYLGSGSETLAEVNRSTAIGTTILNAPGLPNAIDPTDSREVARAEVGEVAIYASRRRKPDRGTNKENTPSRLSDFARARTVSKNFRQPTRTRKPIFVNTIITYPGTKTTDNNAHSFDSDDSRLADGSIKGKKNRSFFSRSVSVLKKPYDWVKAVGSKLD